MKKKNSQMGKQIIRVFYKGKGRFGIVIFKNNDNQWEKTNVCTMPQKNLIMLPFPYGNKHGDMKYV